VASAPALLLPAAAAAPAADGVALAPAFAGWVGAAAELPAGLDVIVPLVADGGIHSERALEPAELVAAMAAASAGAASVQALSSTTDDNAHRRDESKKGVWFMAYPGGRRRYRARSSMTTPRSLHVQRTWRRAIRNRQPDNTKLRHFASIL
jgi:hypothetical protein